MTRPMPGPPEKYQLRGPMVIVWEGGNGYSLMDDKHLSDAECAAEYWREQAEWWAGTHTKGPTAEDVDIRRVATWERFATHSHANQETRA